VIPIGRIFAVQAWKPDVIHTQTFFGVGIEALIASKLLGIPLVGTNHTAIKEFLRYNPLESQWSDNLVIRYVNWYYSKCVTVTAPSQSVFKEMDCFAFCKARHRHVKPIDTVTFHPMRGTDKLRKKFGVGEWPIMHAGRLAPERSIDVIIRALPLVKKKFLKRRS